MRKAMLPAGAASAAYAALTGATKWLQTFAKYAASDQSAIAAAPHSSAKDTCVTVVALTCSAVSAHACVEPPKCVYQVFPVQK